MALGCVSITGERVWEEGKEGGMYCVGSRGGRGVGRPIGS